MAASSTFEINDTLQITKGQWFPTDLDIDRHFQHPYSIDDVVDKVYEFRDKPWMRNFTVPPARCFLVENRDGKWIYRWHCHILEVTIDYIARTTSGKFTIIKIFSPDEMKSAFYIADRFEENNYFA